MNRKRRAYLILWLVCLLCVALLFQPALAAGPSYGSQLENGEWNNVSQRGQWDIQVPGRTTVGPGPGDMTWGFYFSDPRTGTTAQSTLSAEAHPVTPEMAMFREDWLGTAQYIHRYAYETFGDLLQFISFDSVNIAPDDDIYVIYLKLGNRNKQMEVTLCYRFGQSWYASYMGINEGDMPEMFLLTKRAAASFSDLTTAPFSANLENSYSVLTPEPSWELPVLNLPEILWSYCRLEFADRPATTARQRAEAAAAKAKEEEPIGGNWEERQAKLLRNPDAIADHIIPSPYEQEEGWYLLQTADDLVLLGQLLAEQATFEEGVRAQLASYRLINDIDLTPHCGPEGWQPIGQFVWGGVGAQEQYLGFLGVFDGGGKEITGLTVRPGEGPMFSGLFGFATHAEIRSVRLVDCDVEGKGSTGAIAGGLFNTWSDEELTIRDCHVTGTVSGTSGTGGIVGVATQVENCSFTGRVESRFDETYGNPQMTGGIVGSGWNVRGCRVEGQIIGHQTVGGLGGTLLRIQDSCFFGGVEGIESVGGLGGSLSEISGSYSVGTVSGYSKIGGLAGSLSTKYNIEPQPTQGRALHCLMAGESMTKIQQPEGEELKNGAPSRICGSLGSDTGTDEIYAIQELVRLPSGYFFDTYQYNGESISRETLKNPVVLRGILEVEGRPWEQIWKPLEGGYYPQLLWETDPPVAIE